LPLRSFGHIQNNSCQSRSCNFVITNFVITSFMPTNFSFMNFVISNYFISLFINMNFAITNFVIPNFVISNLLIIEFKKIINLWLCHIKKYRPSINEFQFFLQIIKLLLSFIKPLFCYLSIYWLSNQLIWENHRFIDIDPWN